MDEDLASAAGFPEPGRVQEASEGRNPAGLLDERYPRRVMHQGPDLPSALAEGTDDGPSEESTRSGH